jgi:2-C-methyl-D-erythritol 4-phosphate cytidylyltransferase
LAFERCPSIAQYVIVSNPTRHAGIRKIVDQYRLGKLAAIVPGGDERHQSVQNGLDALPDRGIVAIHDAARPLVTPAMLDAGIRACRRYRAVTYGHRVTDTLKQMRGAAVVGTVDRSRLVAVQTPQFFDIALLRRAYARSSRVPATDDCAVVERIGVRPHWLPGPRSNIKVTFPEDLQLCEAILCGVSE